MSERTHPKLGLSFISCDTISKILQKHSAYNPFDLMCTTHRQTYLSLLEKIQPFSNKQNKSENNIYNICNIILHNDTSFLKQEFTTTIEGFSSQNIITIGKALFPYLFPFGIGAYDKNIPLDNYIRMRISFLFSVFTLHKPYILVMYQLRQSIT